MRKMIPSANVTYPTDTQRKKREKELFKIYAIKFSKWAASVWFIAFRFVGDWSFKANYRPLQKWALKFRKAGSSLCNNAGRMTHFYFSSNTNLVSHYALDSLIFSYPHNPLLHHKWRLQEKKNIIYWYPLPCSSHFGGAVVLFTWGLFHVWPLLKKIYI